MTDGQTEIKDKIELEVERRLRERLSELESQIRLQVKEEFDQTANIKPETSDGKTDVQEKVETILPEPISEAVPASVSKEESDEYFLRFGLNFRLQHIGLLVSTTMLILSGVPLKFPKNGASQLIINWFGGAGGARSVHHFFALCLICIGIYHLIYSFWAKQGRKDFYELLPGLKDLSDLYNQLKHYIGLRKEKVNFGRFSYVEKFDYWAVYWGLIMMVGTGIAMWFFQGKFEPMIIGEINLPFGPDIVTNTVHAIAREMHSDEALLATLVIIGWHFYNVHLNPHKFPMSKVWLTGKVTKKEMLEEHPLEYEEHKK